MSHLWKIGTIAAAETLLRHGIEPFRQMRMDTLQLSLGDEASNRPETISRLKEVLSALPADTAVLGWPGPAHWDFTQGPATLGLIPEEWRAIRQQCMKDAIVTAGALGIPLAQTHIGFVPEDPAQPLYQVMVEHVRDLALHSAQFGITFCLETGQETPVTLLRLIEDVGEPNVGINLDPANLLMYGKGNPSDAMDLFGGHVRSLHMKDGAYPTTTYKLGEEYPLGEGQVDFPAIFRKLKALHFKGPLIIEREISGPQQMKDVAQAVTLIEGWMQDLECE